MSFFDHKHPGDAVALMLDLPGGSALDIAKLEVKLVAEPFFKSAAKKAAVSSRKGVRITVWFECTTRKPTNLCDFPKLSFPLHIQYFRTHARTHLNQFTHNHNSDSALSWSGSQRIPRSQS